MNLNGLREMMIAKIGLDCLAEFRQRRSPFTPSTDLITDMPERRLSQRDGPVKYVHTYPP